MISLAEYLLKWATLIKSWFGRHILPYSLFGTFNFKLLIFGVNFRKISAFKKNNKETKTCVPEEAMSDLFVS